MNVIDVTKTIRQKTYILKDRNGKAKKSAGNDGNFKTFSITFLPSLPILQVQGEKMSQQHAKV